MEKRKIVKSGNTSYTIAIPIEWIRKNKLDKGSEINVSENESGELALSPIKSNITNKETLTIKTDEKDIKDIEIELLNAYLRNNATIILEGKDLSKIRTDIKSLISEYIGLDIIEGSINTMILKNFSTLDNEMQPKDMIKKFDLGIRDMFNILETFFYGKYTKQDYFELIKSNEQNRRIYLLLRKIILKTIERPQLLKEYKTTFHQITKDKSISMILNQISRTLTNFGKSFIYLEHNKKDVLTLKEIFNTVYNEYKHVMSTMRYKNYEDLFKYLNKHKENYEKWESFLKTTKNSLVIESINIAIFLNQLLNQLAFEILE